MVIVGLGYIFLGFRGGGSTTTGMLLDLHPLDGLEHFHPVHPWQAQIQQNDSVSSCLSIRRILRAGTGNPVQIAHPGNDGLCLQCGALSAQDQFRWSMLSSTSITRTGSPIISVLLSIRGHFSRIHLSEQNHLSKCNEHPLAKQSWLISFS